jgi:hypothetical protein
MIYLKNIIIIFLVSASIFLIFGYGFPNIYADKNGKAFTKRQRPHVNFIDDLHELHMDYYDCIDCHHRYEDNKNIIDESELEEGNPDIHCSSCHGRTKTALRESFHTQCIGCHDNYNDTENSSLPVFCGECHVRRVIW